MWKAQYEQFNSWHDMTFQSINIQPGPNGLIKGHGQD